MNLDPRLLQMGCVDQFALGFFGKVDESKVDDVVFFAKMYGIG